MSEMNWQPQCLSENGCRGGYNTKCTSMHQMKQPQRLKMVDNGQNGHFTIKNKSLNYLCALSFGQQCTDGVTVEIKQLNIPNGEGILISKNHYILQSILFNIRNYNPK